MDPFQNQTETRLSRRRFLEVGLGLIGGLVGAILGVPIVGYILSPALRRQAETAWAEVGAVDRFPLNEPILTHFYPKSRADLGRQEDMRVVYVVNRGEGRFDCYDVRCTHLGCPVQYREGPRKYFSPCHGGVFDFDSRVVAGPPPRPLDRYEVKVENGVLYAGALYRVNDRFERVS